MTYYDIYAHKRTSAPDVEEILTNYVDSATEDLEDDLPCSVGVHPKSIDDDIDDVLLFTRELAHDPNVVAIGGCGLDRAIPVGWVNQIHAFEDQIALSELLCKPMIVHCVRAHADVVMLRRELHAVQPWVIHAFDKAPDTLERVIDADLCVSFGAAIMSSNSPAAQCLAVVAADKFFLETANQTQFSISELYQQAATLRGISVEQLCQTLQQNYEAVFKH